MATEPKSEKRAPLTREKVFAAAIQLADESGLEAVTMRRLAERLDVEAMSLYYHVANKEAILDGMVDALMDEIEAEIGDFGGVPGGPWKRVMRDRILIARSAMLRHRWAPELLETRTQLGAPMIRYYDSLLGIMVEGGFSYDLGHHALHAFGSLALGFSQELFSPATDQVDQAEEDTTDMLDLLADQVPYLGTMMTVISHDDGPEETVGWCDDNTEFEFALDLILDGLEARRKVEQGTASPLTRDN